MKLKTGDLVRCDGYQGPSLTLKPNLFKLGVVSVSNETEFFVNWLHPLAMREWFTQSPQDPDDGCNYLRLHCEAL